MKDSIQHINPSGLFKSPAFSQAVITQGHGKTIYIGGQNSVNVKGEVVGKGDLQAQTEQVMTNIQTALAACDATFKNVVKLSINIVAGQDPKNGFKAAEKFLKDSEPPVITVLLVSSLGNPDFLLEIDAIAFVA